MTIVTIVTIVFCFISLIDFFFNLILARDAFFLFGMVVC